MNESSSSNNLTRTTLNVAAIGGLAVTSFWVMQPFLLGLIWAATIVVATWPLLEIVRARVKGHRALAATIMTLALLIIFLLPLGIAVTTIISHFDEIAALVNSAHTWKLPTAPEWVAALPLAGEKITDVWNEVAEKGFAYLTPYANQIFLLTTKNLSSVGSALMQIGLTLAISAVLYFDGDTAAHGIRKFFHRLAGDQGDRAVVLASQAVRGVALGVVVTALLQSLLGGIGLWLTGIPFAGPLILMMFIFCLAQIGPTLVLLPIVGWLYWSDQGAAATALLVITIVAGTMDNFLRPYFIKRGADLPMLLIFVGVIGGLLGFGPIGIFIGPVVLAVTYKLIEEWIDEDQPLPVSEVALCDREIESVGADAECRLSTADPLRRHEAVLRETPASPPSQNTTNSDQVADNKS
ncbi:MAG: AI-2E family transporter YdiK [Rhodocyclaceae bacterium]|nr:AI-2E family transporter YdiK [Rhodocyclaceae bacterium]